MANRQGVNNILSIIKNHKKAILVAFVVVFALIIGVRVLGGIINPEVSEGIKFIEALETQDLNKVEDEVRTVSSERLSSRLEVLRQELLDGEVDVWSMFGNFVLLGDSRAVGFYYNEFLPEERVLAEGGHTIRNIEEALPKIEEINPDYIFLCYGLNDVSIGFWDTPEEYVTEYMNIVKDLNQKFPNAKVFINSTLPAKDPAFELSEKWRNIPLFNDALKAACRENGVAYVDNTEIAQENIGDLWDIDGIHVKREFYPIWATNIILTVFEYEA